MAFGYTRFNKVGHTQCRIKQFTLPHSNTHHLPSYDNRGRVSDDAEPFHPPDCDGLTLCLWGTSYWPKNKASPSHSHYVVTSRVRTGGPRLSGSTVISWITNYTHETREAVMVAMSYGEAMKSPYNKAEI